MLKLPQGCFPGNIGLRRMRVLIYKRTHTGDPCKCGIFGVNDCMGRFRERWKYDAVLGIGAVHPWPDSMDIKGKLTWVGIFRQKGVDKYQHNRGPVFTFKHFRLMDGSGPEITECAPELWNYVKSRRSFVLDLSRQNPSKADIQRQVEDILKRHQKNPKSISRSGECHCQE